MRLTSRLALILLLCGTPLSLSGQGLLDSISFDTEPVVSGTGLFAGTRLAGGATVETANRGELKMLIQHRFGNLSGGLYQFFGLDQATMRLGFEYGITDRITVSVGRSTEGKSYDGSVKAAIASGKIGNMPAALSFNGEASSNTIRGIYPEEYDNMGGRISISAQLLGAVSAGRFTFQAAPAFLYTGYELSTFQPERYILIGTGAKFEVSSRVDITAEYYYNMNRNGEQENPLTIGVDLDTGGHLFQLVFSNSTGMINRNLFTGTTGSWSEGDIYFGFNLVRTFYTGNN